MKPLGARTEPLLVVSFGFPPSSVATFSEDKGRSGGLPREKLLVVFVVFLVFFDFCSRFLLVMFVDLLVFVFNSLKMSHLWR